MCMSCGSGMMSTKKKVTIFCSASLAIAIATYLGFTTTNNPAIAAALPALLSLGVCPLMCAVVGGLMWISRRSSISNNMHTHDNHDESIDTCETKNSTFLARRFFQRINKNLELQGLLNRLIARITKAI